MLGHSETTQLKEEDRVHEVMRAAHENLKGGSFLGRHIIAEFFEADKEALNNGDKLCEAMNEAAKAAGATILSSHQHFFEPHGVSCVVIIQESNLCIHTWPEYGYAAADFFTCGEHTEPWKSFEFLKTFLKAKSYNCLEFDRGSTATIKEPTLTHKKVQEAISLRGDSDNARFIARESVCVNIPEGYSAITADELNDDIMQIVTTIVKVIDCQQSKYQKILIADHKWWGRCMWVDDVPNVCEKDDFIYHELLVHVPMMTHPKPTRALIIGGGDGGSARELLKHPDLQNAVMIDIDEVIIKLCKEYLPMVNDGAFDNPNLNLIIGDGIDYVKKAADGSFDVIIVDSTDPVPGGVGEVLFTKEFYEQCFRILSPNGVISTQALMPLRYDADVYKNSMANLQHAFGEENVYVYFAPTDFYGGLTSFSLCFKEGVHPKRIDKQRIKSFSKQHKLKYYNHNMHLSSLCLPGYVRDMLYGKK